MEDRIFVGWSGGYFMTSLGCENFQAEFQAMVDDLGPPSVVEFRPADEGWLENTVDDISESDDVTEIAK
tara:strand:- start:323 stop:529 length:207 start_codon:yes stop_codon:yes gene_type:complete